VTYNRIAFETLEISSRHLMKCLGLQKKIFLNIIIFWEGYPLIS